jgi:hypothetical protein
LESSFSNKNNLARKRLTNTDLLGLNNMRVDQGNRYEKELGDILPLNPRNSLPPSFERYALRRRLAVTKKGYIRLVSKAKGGRVAVLMGSETPFILRKRSAGRFVVIGETYMHRIIGREVIEASKIGRIENGKIALHQQVFAGSFKECS